MPPQPPSFGSQEYWDARFTSNSSPFEWLEAPNALDSFLVEALRATLDENPHILHIGCGTSLLSYHLRAHVKDPEKIHNLDYSDVAINIGRNREGEIYNSEVIQNAGDGADSSNCPSTNDKDLKGANNADGSNQNEPHLVLSRSKPAGNETETTVTKKRMRWSSANLLSHSSLLEVCEPSAYSVIVDKSTSDSVACSEDVTVPLPYPIGIDSASLISSRGSESPEPIHPLHILAIHMALLTKPGARWISLSYSEDRYPFLPRQLPPPPQLASTSTTSQPPAPTISPAGKNGFGNGGSEFYDDLDDIPQKVIDSGLADPGTLWRLEAKHEIEVPPQIPPSGASSGAHQPRILHWVYILRRTNIKVHVRDS